MAKRMLINASQPEETRVVVLSDNILEDFDFESTAKKSFKGNIYLAKVVRVEPSLQAAFVDFGGNRHGFLAFNEIHHDYYKIPVADRKALIAEEARMASSADADTSFESSSKAPQKRSKESESPAGNDGDETDGGKKSKSAKSKSTDEPTGDVAALSGGVKVDVVAEASASGADEDAADTVNVVDNDDEATQDDKDEEFEDLETVGGDTDEDMVPRRASAARHYKIQEVIKRGQILLIQVAKEERGTKGAALTTRISLAGRYCVLMPNMLRGGGVSRKIANPADRRKLKTILDGLSIPEGIAVIVRTAGHERTKAEIKRDYEYLMRLWSEIRDTALQSSAPSLVYEEANIIKRAVRDLYSRDMEEVLVDSEEAYRLAKESMRMLTPSHAKRVKRYRDDDIPLFASFDVEEEIDAIHNHSVRLKAGGYIVIDQTEALVSIDVNSGRSTRERNIEETALKTNIEAADEVARQLRLRDLAGLIVIDFIDMDEHRNRSKVEKRIKEALKTDRARIQIGRISGFGLLEMSRQRLRPSLHEISTQICPHCGSKGIMRSIESTALRVLRAIEKEGIRNRKGQIFTHVPPEVDLYILNQKRDVLSAIESRHDLRIMIYHDASLVPPDFRIQGGAHRKTADAKTSREEMTDSSSSPQRNERRYIKDAEETARTAGTVATGVQDASPATAGFGGGDQKDKPIRKRRRRGKRGGRRHSRKSNDGATTIESAVESTAESSDMDSRSETPFVTTEAAATKEGDKPTAKPRKKPERRTRKPAKSAAAEKTTEKVEEKTTGTARKEKAVENATATAVPAAKIPATTADRPKRRGWWNSLVE